MILRYHLKSVNARHSTDLQDFAKSIISSVHKVFPTSHVEVYPDYFEIEGEPEELSKLANLQNMGRAISFNTAALREHVTTYGNSRQLFTRCSKGGRMA